MKYDRQVYRKSDAPDVIYGNVNESWKKTQPDVNVPIMDLGHDKHDPYYYMPKPCGEEDSRSQFEIEQEQEYLARRLSLKPNKPRPKIKPEPLERFIQTPVALQRNTSSFDNRYADVFNRPKSE